MDSSWHSPARSATGGAFQLVIGGVTYGQPSSVHLTLAFQRAAGVPH